MNATAAATAARIQTDAELVAQVRAGDDDAFAELYRRYRPRIGVFVRRMVRDDGRAEDLTQDAFVAALRRMRETDCEILFRPWIYEIARNATIDLHRRAGRSSEVSLDGGTGLRASDLLRYDACSPGPDAVVLGRERFENLRGALDELPAAHNRIIVLRELEGLSYREIGERMGLTPAAVESTLFRARRNLASEYDQIGTGRRCRTIGVVIARLSEGSVDERDRARVARHARRCAACRRGAAALGIQPAPSRAARVAAFLPVLGIGPGASSLVAQGTSVIAATAVVAGGGAAIMGAGPLSAHHHSHARSAEHRSVAPRRKPAGLSGRSQGRPAPTRAGSTPRLTPGSAPRRGRARPKRPSEAAPGGALETPSGPPEGPSTSPAAPGSSLPPLPGIAKPPVEVPDLALPPVKVPVHVPDIPPVPGADRLPAAVPSAGYAAEVAGSLLP